MAARGGQRARAKADARTMLLRPASNHRILLCSPNTVLLCGPLTAPQGGSSSTASPGQPACPCKIPTTRERVVVHRRTRGTLEEEPTRTQRAPPGGQRLWRARCESQRECSLSGGTPYSNTAPGILCPTSSLLHTHTLIDVYYLSHAFPLHMNHQHKNPTSPPTMTITATEIPAIAPVGRPPLLVEGSVDCCVT